MVPRLKTALAGPLLEFERRILDWENHTPNLNYLQNVATLEGILEKAGMRVLEIEALDDAPAAAVPAPAL